MCVVIDNFVVRAIIAFIVVVVFRIIAADAFIVIIVVIVIVITVIGFIDVTVIIIVFYTYASKLCERYNIIPILLEIVITRAAPAFHKLFMVMGCAFDTNTVHKTVEKLTFQAFY